MAPAATGSQTVFGMAEEVTWNTPVTVTRFLPVLRETLHREQNTLQSQAIKPAAVGVRTTQASSARAISTETANGGIETEVLTRGFGILLKHIMGGTPVTAQQGGTAAYKHTFTLGPQNSSLTLQTSIRDTNADPVIIKTYPGAKVTNATFSISTDALLTADISFDAAREITNVAAAAPSYGSGKPFSFKQGSLSVAGSTIATVSEASIGVENPLNVERHFLGSTGIKGEQTENGLALLTGDLTAELEDKATFYDRWIADEGVALVLLFEGDTIASTYKETFKITLPDVHFTGESPQIGGPETVAMSVPFEGLYNGVDAPMTIEYITADITI